MKESSSNTILNQYLRETRFYCYYELKEVTRNTFNFSLIEDNQKDGLPALSNNGLVWKLSDEDSRKKPCDGFCTPPLPAYLVLKFKDSFAMLEYSHIQKLIDEGVKSINKSQALDLADRVIHTRAL